MSSATTLDFTLRYQRTPCAKYHVRPLSLLQQDIRYRCDGRVTVADLADATLHTHPEIRAALGFLARHGLVKTLPPESWMLESFPRVPVWHHETAERPSFRPRVSFWRWLDVIKTLRVAPRR
ncbi:MAG TPA: hypothetical protein VKT82_12325 [Ktedonobacterales bacterium]|nr:hypothetical protein [Ktedonobacterales bacterium]